MGAIYNKLLRRSLMQIHRTRNVDAAFPLCHTCGRTLDKEAIVENRPGLPKSFITILVEHHGAEDRAEFDMGSETETDYRDIARIMQRHTWFDPRRNENT